MPEKQRRKAFISVRMTEQMRADVDRARDAIRDEYGDPVTFSKACQILIGLGLEEFPRGAPEQGQ